MRLWQLQRLIVALFGTFSVSHGGQLQSSLHTLALCTPAPCLRDALAVLPFTHGRAYQQAVKFEAEVKTSVDFLSGQLLRVRFKHLFPAFFSHSFV